MRRCEKKKDRAEFHHGGTTLDGSRGEFNRYRFLSKIDLTSKLIDVLVIGFNVLNWLYVEFSIRLLSQALCSISHLKSIKYSSFRFMHHNILFTMTNYMVQLRQYLDLVVLNENFI